MRSLGWALVQYDWSPHKQGGLDAETGMKQGRWKRHTGRRRPRNWRVYQQAEHCRPVSRLLEEAKAVLLQSRGLGGRGLPETLIVQSNAPLLSRAPLDTFILDRTYIYGVLSCQAVGIILLYWFIFGCTGSWLLFAGVLEWWRWGLLSSCCGWAFRWSHFSCCAAWAIGMRAQFLWPWGIRYPPRPGIKPMSPALAGELFTTGSPGTFQLLEF